MSLCCLAGQAFHFLHLWIISVQKTNYGGLCMVHSNMNELFWFFLNLISASPSSPRCHISSLVPLGDLGCPSDIPCFGWVTDFLGIHKNSIFTELSPEKRWQIMLLGAMHGVQHLPHISQEVSNSSKTQIQAQQEQNVLGPPLEHRAKRI